jgi:hypothetical protein
LPARWRANPKEFRDEVRDVRPVVERYRVERNADVLSWVLPTDLGGTAFGGNRALAAEQTLSYTLVLPSFSTVETAFPDGGHRLVVQLAVPIDAAGERCRQFYAVGLDAVASRHPEASLDEVFEYERRIFERIGRSSSPRRRGRPRSTSRVRRTPAPTPSVSPIARPTGPS